MRLLGRADVRQPSFVLKRMCVKTVTQGEMCGVSKQRGREGYPTNVDGCNSRFYTLGKLPASRTLNPTGKRSQPDQRTPVAPNMRYAQYRERY